MLRPICLLTLVSLFSGSLRAIVVASGDPSSSVVAYKQVVDGANLNGVVELDSSDGFGCSGSLLSDGYSILTAAHCVTSSPSYVNVYFPGPSGSVDYIATTYYVDPLYTGDSTQGNDLAIVRLNQAPPSSAIGYSLYTGFTTSTILLAGYGETGTGTTAFSRRICPSWSPCPEKWTSAGLTSKRAFCKSCARTAHLLTTLMVFAGTEVMHRSEEH